MNGAVFFLGVNFVVAICFCIVFAVVSTRSRSRVAALWFGAGFGVASLAAVCEIAVAYLPWPRPWAIGAFATVLGGMIFLLFGIGSLYDVRINRRLAGLMFAVSSFGNVFVYDLRPGTPLHAFSYQTPFALVILASAGVVLQALLRSNRQLLIDKVVCALLAVTGVHFIAKAVLAIAVGAGSVATDYIRTDYALISQSLTAVLMVAVGLTLLSVLVLEIMADERSVSESDALSGLANRRGFERRVRSAIATFPKGPHAVVLCDLDRFKTINDTYGHHAGDMVIQSFGTLLSSCAPKEAIVGRMGGEEFSVFLPNTPMDVALMVAQALRGGTMAMSVAGLPPTSRITASFGVANLTSPDALDEMFRQADVALYAAKRAGRNRVHEATSDDGRPRAAHVRPVN
ncbi:diguanylate cyclase [Neorhizobium sp. AL 9.2.2]|uniref:GGDEF domain-containing protein n=1 Tax=Neorhizobium sp. AL 9.2.2 TaxID=2712894 RepID=UPI001573A3D7|nr:GGDEF domain-containing protein [Neorhizobium sp. AL 9.2.2]NSY18019.1 GGDEF domain-containing protein [Neorhizobium sp. AL 9.2.2]